jgi:putative FmdB family regulatory protein
MPIYEYRCDGCGKVFEKICKSDESGEAGACPSCGGKTEKVLSSFSCSKGSTAGSSSSCGPKAGSRFS